jgi:lipopolysaccharide transport system ATP-binding protein
MNAIVAYELSKRYTIRVAQPEGPRKVEKVALDAVSFVVPEGEVLGIIGANGAGKSTLLKVLSRITAPTGGRAEVRGRVATLLEVGTGMHPDMTGRENVFLNGALLGMSRADVALHFDEILDFAGIGNYVDTPIRHYSSGMKLRLAFAVGAHLAADVMIVDEVLAVGDAEFQERCLGVMRQGNRSGRTTLFVSHNLPVVENLCHRVMWLQGGRLVRVGPAGEVVRAYLQQAVGGAGTSVQFAPSPGPVRWLEASAGAPEGGAPVQGERLEIVARIALERSVRQLKVRVAVTTLEGHPVCNLTSADFRRDWSLAPGEYKLRITLSELRLMPRLHQISLWLYTSAGKAGEMEILDHRPDALTFQPIEKDVLGTGCRMLPDRGITWFPAEFSLERP